MRSREFMRLKSMSWTDNPACAWSRDTFQHPAIELLQPSPANCRSFFPAVFFLASTGKSNADQHDKNSAVAIRATVKHGTLKGGPVTEGDKGSCDPKPRRMGLAWSGTNNGRTRIELFPQDSLQNSIPCPIMEPRAARVDRAKVSIRPFKSRSCHCNALISLARKPKHIAIMTIT